MGIVYANKTRAVRQGSGLVVIRRGEAYDDGAELVRKYPHFFEGEPSRVQGRTRGRVETATRAPGEKRGRGRPKLPRDEQGNVVREGESSGE